MVVAIALGIGASMTTLTVFHVLSGDPIPDKSDRLFYVQVDPRPRAGYLTGEEPESQMTRFDAETLLREKRGERQAMMSAGDATIEPEGSALKPFNIDTRWTSADFFPMFNVPMLYGRAWTASDDDGRARVVCCPGGLMMPLSTAMDLKLGSNGNMNCFRDGAPDDDSNSINAPCTWIQYWVELDPSKAEDYRPTW
ncbi:macB-like periplasmic core domain-containing protein [Ditylenchus destructor]|uniref:MacB-like periplasmic core domain-containing protein n=1 Tax=Ditylenchus destructor TaxID=166010 RepID=A0AAD4QUY4_9BILA|nr:macB-like periplasmic core domain-containing protein [Ditylenchus destructor]